MKSIPLFDLQRQHLKLQNKILANISRLYSKNEFTAGSYTQRFESEFAKMCKTKYALGVHSGTDALIIALKAAGINIGDEVITTPCTFSASADSIIHSGATPVFADVDPITGNIDPKEIAKKITAKTKAILVVHLYGIPCEMDEILPICKKHKLILIEDASHAHGSLYKGKPVGSFGLAGCFSLYPSKSLGAIGNAGIITSNSSRFIQKAKMFANHGIKTVETKYTHHLPGFNKLIDNIQCAALIEKLPDLSKIIDKKISIAKKYNAAFKKINLGGMQWPSWTKPSIYVYAFQSTNRKKAISHFQSKGISTGIYYPTPLHLQPSMKFLGHKKGNFPKAEKFFNKTLSLPIFPELTNREVSQIAEAIKSLKFCKIINKKF